ncbi:MAG TPA: tetratricopeptide repeat protein [candidate division Zixibacteria bacterium]|jgi:tetratricopeptide (TPR) repeat protein
MTGSPEKQSYSFWIIGALLAGGIIRAIYLWQSSASPFFDGLISDAAHFDQWGRAIAAGDVYGSGPYFRAPFYAYFLGLLYRLFGHELILVRVLQHVIGLAGVWITARLAARLWDGRVAAMTAWIMALYPTTVFFEGEILSDSILVALSSVILLTIVCGLHDHRRWLLFVGGLTVGLFAITRPTILATVPILLAWMVWDRRRERPSGHRIRNALVYLVGIVLLIAPVTLRNLIVGDDFVLIATQGGVNFYAGNNADADGVSVSIAPWGNQWATEDVQRAAEQARGRALTASGVSGYWTSRALEYWTESPLDAFLLYVRKFAIFWQNTEFENTRDIDWSTARWGQVLRWIPLSYGLLVAVGLYGWIRRNSSGGEGRFWIAVWAVSYAMAVSAFFVVARFRLPIVGVLAIGCAAGVVSLWKTASTRHWRSFSRDAVAVTLLCVLVHIDWFGLSRHSQARSYFTLGNTLARSSAHAAALAAYDSALVHDHAYRGAWQGRGVVFYRLGLHDSAASSFEREMQLHPGNLGNRVNLAQTWIDRGEFDAASSLLSGVLAENPSQREALPMSARLLRRSGRSRQALSVLRMAGASGGSDPEQTLLEGVLLLDLGELDDAASRFRTYLTGSQRGSPGIDQELAATRLIADDPSKDVALAHYNLGVIAGYRNQWEDAAQHLATAVTGDSALSAAWSNLATAHLTLGRAEEALSAAATAVKLEPENTTYLYTLALVQGSRGDSSGSIETLRRTLAIDSTFAPARALLRQLP